MAADPPPPRWMKSFMDGPFAKIGLHIAIFSLLKKKMNISKQVFFKHDSVDRFHEKIFITWWDSIYFTKFCELWFCNMVTLGILWHVRKIFLHLLSNSYVAVHCIATQFHEKSFTCAKGTKFSPPILPPRYIEQWCQRL